MATRQQFKSTQVLRLEIEVAQDPGLYQLLPSDAPAEGGWGWLTPHPNTQVTGPSPANGFDWFAFYYSGVPVIPAHFTSDTFPVNPGQFVGARWDQGSPDGTLYTRPSVEWLNAAGAVISTSAQGGYVAAGTANMATGGAVVSYVTAAAPAGTVRARLRIDCYSSTSGGGFSGVGLWFRRPVVVKGATAAAVTNPSTGLLGTRYAWSNVISPTHTIEVEREDLNLGTLTADVLEVALDPANSTLVRPGKRVRLRVLADGSTWTDLFVGRIVTGSVKYHPERKSPDSKRARVRITAVDGMGVLAQHPRPNGVGTIAELPTILEGAGVPWDVAGFRSHRWNPPVVVSTNERATAADQLAIVRDSTLTYAWIGSATSAAGRSASTSRSPPRCSTR